MKTLKSREEIFLKTTFFCQKLIKNKTKVFFVMYGSLDVDWTVNDSNKAVWSPSHWWKGWKTKSFSFRRRFFEKPRTFWKNIKWSTLCCLKVVIALLDYSSRLSPENREKIPLAFLKTKPFQKKLSNFRQSKTSHFTNHTLEQLVILKASAMNQKVTKNQEIKLVNLVSCWRFWWNFLAFKVYCVIEWSAEKISLLFSFLRNLKTPFNWAFSRQNHFVNLVMKKVTLCFKLKDSGEINARKNDKRS